MLNYVRENFDSNDTGRIAEDACYLDCQFDRLVAEGAVLSGSLFVDCRFESTDLYWCHAFRCRFIDCTFECCDLRGNFDEAIFVRCRFSECELGKNNLGGETVWEGAFAVDCVNPGLTLPIVPSKSF